MRVVVNDWDEFCEEIAAEAKSIHASVIRVRIDRTPLQPEAIACRLKLWGTAVVASQETEYLIECGVELGIDDEETGEHTGTMQAQAKIGRLKDMADTHGLQIRHGKIEVM